MKPTSSLYLSALALTAILCTHISHDAKSQTQVAESHQTVQTTATKKGRGKKKDKIETQEETSALTNHSSCSGFRTQTQGGWGNKANGNNPGSYRDQHFDDAFPNGLTIGCGDRKLVLTSAKAVQNFLPSGSSARMLPKGTKTNPGKRYKNVLAGQLVAATLSVGFDDNDASFSSSDVALADLKFNSGPFFDKSVSEVLEIANEFIGGCSQEYSATQLNNVLTSFNENYVDGKRDNGKLSCPITNDVQVNEITCNGGNDGAISIVNISGGTSPYSIAWSNAQSGATASGLIAGSYTYTITDAKGLSASASVTLSQPKPFTIEVNWTNPSCDDEPNGTITASGAASYAWSTGESGGVITGLSSGTYAVTATSESGCIVIKEVVLVSNPCCNVTNAGTIGNAQSSCVPFDPAPITSVTLPTGGQGTLEYQWLKKLPGGSYSMIQGANSATYDPGMINTTTMYRRCARRSGCTAFVGESNWITMSVEPSVSVSIEAVQPICAGVTGSLSAVAMGNGSLSYQWSNGSTASSITGLGAGTYTVTVADNQGCYATASGTITIPEPVSVIVNTTGVTGFGQTDGTATASPQGGTSPYSYTWDNGGTTQSISGLGVGTYYVTVEDVNGCDAIAEGFVSGPIAAKRGLETPLNGPYELKLTPNVIQEGMTAATVAYDRALTGNETLEVFNLQGKMIMSLRLTSNVMELPKLNGLSKGVYLMRLLGTRTNETIRFMVQ